MSAEPVRNVEDLIARTQKFVTSQLVATVEHPVRAVGRRIGGRLVKFVVGATLVTCSAGFLLFGLMSLLTLWVPLFAACLAVGGGALVLGLLLLI